uniref:Uncharacterized protein n=1 Tax=Globodera rostochiensis TaxID=31243 RepID=A0A914H9U8_GLORO
MDDVIRGIMDEVIRACVPYSPSRPMFVTWYGGGTMQQFSFTSGDSATVGRPANFQLFQRPSTRARTINAYSSGGFGKLNTK